MESPKSAFQVYNLANISSDHNISASRKRKEKFKKNLQRNDASFYECSHNRAKKIRKLHKTKANMKLNCKMKNSENVSKLKNKQINKNNRIQTKQIVKLNHSLPVPESSRNGTLQPVKGSSDSDTIDDSIQSVEFYPVTTDSSEEGLKALEWLIAPYSADDFLNKIWEKSPLHIVRKKPDYYRDIISTPIIDNMLRTESIIYTKNIDITSYTEGKRETHNPVGRAHPHTVWDYYLNGCSIRLLNPQTYIQRLHLLNATLQEFFNSFVGANAYLTPPDSQGFAPHYDDIEALIMQIEGKKHWKVYRPRTDNEILPRESSKNFDQDEIGKPILEVTLEAGDMLYFPRGFIHQGVTVDGEHSLHVTVSFYQNHSWANLLEKIVPAALQEAIENNVELRKGLPFDIYDNFGVVNSDVNTPRKHEITNVIQSLFDKVKDYLPIDTAVDEMAKRFQHTALPPVLNDAERAATVYGDSDVMIDNGKVTQRVEIELDTRIRLLRKNILRLVNEQDGLKVYFYSENSLEYEGNEPQFLEIDEKFAPAIETLILTYPEYVSVENLGIEDDSDKIQISSDLWENGLIMTEYPLETIED